jgi:aminoglycoside phosphotransferase (APT) family kinase protein
MSANSRSSSSDSSTPLKRNGPTYGISFTRTQADTLIQQYLNETIISFECIDTGYNNLIFFIDTAENTQRYAIKIGGRYWNKIKTEAEVKALELIAKYTTIPAPKVLAYSSDRTNQFGVEWILMTRLSGINMSAICKTQKLSLNARKSIIRDLADYVAQMHFKIPRFDQIGALMINGQIGTDLNRLGPWLTYEQFIRHRVQAEAIILNENITFAPIKDSMLDAIHQFEKFQFPSFLNLPFVFSHGDLDIQNILISIDDPESPRITGIVDWEWAGSFPCSEEYFTSYDYFLNDDNEIRTSFFDELEKRNILTPRTIEQFPVIEKFNSFVTNLALWHLTDLVNPDDPLVNEELEISRSTVQSVLAELRDKLRENTEK